MLADHPIDPMILAPDLAIARESYGERIGLEVLTEPQTKASWLVSNLAAEVAELRSLQFKDAGRS